MSSIINYDWVAIGKRIKEERKLIELSQDELAAKIGVSRNSIGKWERGDDVEITLNSLLDLCNIFQCDLEYLLCTTSYRTRTIADIHNTTGLSEKATTTILNHKEQFGTMDIDILSELIDNTAFWCVLRELRHLYECHIDNTPPETLFHETHGSSSVILKGTAIIDHYINTAINRFSALVRSMADKERR